MGPYYTIVEDAPKKPMRVFHKGAFMDSIGEVSF